MKASSVRRGDLFRTTRRGVAAAVLSTRWFDEVRFEVLCDDGVRRQLRAPHQLDRPKVEIVCLVPGERGVRHYITLADSELDVVRPGPEHGPPAPQSRPVAWVWARSFGDYGDFTARLCELGAPAFPDRPERVSVPQTATGIAQAFGLDRGSPTSEIPCGTIPA